MHLNRIILLAAILAAATLSACDTARPLGQEASAAGTCGTCHGNPPAVTASGVAHPNNPDCHACHPTSVDASGNVIPVSAGGTHGDGKVDGGGHVAGYGDSAQHGYDAVADLNGCKACHGDTFDGGASAPSCNQCHADNGYANWQSNCTFCHGARQPTYAAADLAKAAPPTGVHGETAATDPHVGAHQKHLGKGSVFSNGFACTTCHAVPTTLGHVDGTATLTFGALAKTGGLSPAFAGSACSSVYCHGSGTPVWTGSVKCGDCHGAPPASGLHSFHVVDSGVDCGKCHPGYTASAVNKDVHVDGKPDVAIVTDTGTVSFSTWPSGCGCHKAPYNVPQ